jgi:uncharacterized protein (DUF2344 family)
MYVYVHVNEYGVPEVYSSQQKLAEVIKDSKYCTEDGVNLVPSRLSYLLGPEEVVTLHSKKTMEIVGRISKLRVK